MKKIQRFLRGTALLAVLSLLVSATAFAASVPDPTSDFTSTITLVCFQVILRVIL